MYLKAKVIIELDLALASQSRGRAISWAKIQDLQSEQIGHSFW
jgi:hypothetical protein